MKGKSGDDDLRLRPGRIRSRGPRAGPKTLFAEVITAARKAGYVGKRLPSRKRRNLRRSTFGRGRGVGLRSALLFNRPRRVVVKARVVRHGGRRFRSAALAAHVRYLIIRRRSAIEAVIAHMKSEGHLGRCYLKGRAGDAANVILTAVGYNLRLVLAWLRAFLRVILHALIRALSTPSPLKPAC